MRVERPSAELESFRIVGHRGAKGCAPENTLASFTKAIELGATMVELDIHQSRDRELIVCHDPTVDRTTNGTGRIADLTWEEIRALDAGTWYGPKFRGQGVPRLEDVVGLIGWQVPINIEVKAADAPYAGITDRLAEFLEAHQLTKRVVISSFEPIYLRKLRSRLPQVELALLYSEPREEVCDQALHEGWQALHPHRECVARELVKEAHERGLRVRPWTVNDVRDMRQLIRAGVDGIITDYPDRLVQVARELGVSTSGDAAGRAGRECLRY